MINIGPTTRLEHKMSPAVLSWDWECKYFWYFANFKVFWESAFEGGFFQWLRSPNVGCLESSTLPTRRVSQTSSSNSDSGKSLGQQFYKNSAMMSDRLYLYLQRALDGWWININLEIQHFCFDLYQSFHNLKVIWINHLINKYIAIHWQRCN